MKQRTLVIVKVISGIRGYATQFVLVRRGVATLLLKTLVHATKAAATSGDVASADKHGYKKLETDDIQATPRGSSVRMKGVR